MPGTKTSRNRKYNYKKRKYRRKRSNESTTNLMAFSTRVNLPYVTSALVDPGAGTIGTYVMRANSLFDPDVTSTGHQPRGYDQVMPFYNHYTVLGSKITINFAPPSADVPILVGINLNSNAAPLSDVNDYLESAHTIYAIVPLYSEKTLSHTFSLKKFFHQRGVNEKDNAGSIAANPIEQAYFHIFCIAADRTSNPGAIACTINMHYAAKLTEPRVITQS